MLPSANLLTILSPGESVVVWKLMVAESWPGAGC